MKLRYIFRASMAAAALSLGLGVAVGLDLWRIQTQLVVQDRLARQAESLSDEMLAIADNQTRLARFYVIRREPRYRDYYRQLVAIRQGRQPRPITYPPSYWQLVLSGRKPDRLGPTRSYQTAIAQLQLRPNETQLFRAAERALSQQSRVEEQAIELTDRGDRVAAEGLLWGQDYLIRKNAVLTPTSSLRVVLDSRIDHESYLLQERQKVGLIGLCSLFGLLLLELVGIYALVQGRILGPVKRMEIQSQRLDSGDLEARNRIDQTDEIGLLARQLDAMASSLEQQIRSLAESRQSFATLVQNVQGAVYRCSPGHDEVLHYLSPGIEQLTGHPAEHYLSGACRLRGQIHPDDREMVWQAMDTAVQRGEPYSVEYQLQQTNGDWRWVLDRGLPICDAEGRSLYLEGAIFDINLRKQAEATLALGKSLAEESARLKSEFLANMSHEIRTPMNAVLGMAYLLGRTALDPIQQDYLGRIQRSSQHLLGILNDILDFSRIESGHVEMECIDFTLESVIERISDLHAQTASEKGLELTLSVAPSVPLQLRGDPLRLGQVLSNLVGNAIKFTDQGDVTVIIATVQETDQTVQLRFQVEDTGIGMRPEQLRRIFAPFEQADSTITRRFGGTGLGLAISQRLVELMGGALEVSSRFGRGSRFSFTLPFARSAAPVRLVLPPAQLVGQRVLVVDDNERARQVLTEILSHFHLRAEAVASGPAAVTAVTQAAREQDPYSVLFLDYQMPGMDGLETVLALQPIQPTPQIVLVTAHGRELLVRNATDAGVAEVMTKPVTPSQLLEITTRVIGRSPGLRPTAAPPAPVPEQPSLAGQAVLVVEDNDQNLDYVRLLLEQQHCRVTTARNGVDAVRRLVSGHFALVLMDLQMPVMDGYTACQEIRRQPAFHQLPIIAMTAHVMEEDRQRCLSAGMNDFIPKPIDPEQFFAVLQRWLPHPATDTTPDSPGTGLPQPSGFEGILNLNPELGLEHCGGDRTLYRQHLQQFLEQQRGVSRELQDSLTTGDRSRTEQQLFRLRRGAEQIGAVAIARLAAQMAAQLRLGPSPGLLTSRLVQLNELLRPLVQGLESRLGFGPHQATGQDASEATRICQQLQELLADSDSEAVTLFKQHRTLLLHSLGPQLGGRLQAAIENYDFPVAEQLLERLQPSGPSPSRVSEVRP